MVYLPHCSSYCLPLDGSFIKDLYFIVREYESMSIFFLSDQMLNWYNKRAKYMIWSFPIIVIIIDNKNNVIKLDQNTANPQPMTVWIAQHGYLWQCKHFQYLENSI